MQELLSKMIGRKVDVYCSGSASVRGEVLKVDDGVLYMTDGERQLCYVAVDKIVAVWETHEGETRAGFTSASHK